MCEIINFQRKKGEFLRAAMDQAEAILVKCEAEAEWLRRNGAALAEQVKAALQVQGAIELLLRRRDEFDRFCGVEAGE